MTYRCTECDSEHTTFDSAARCHYGIGGVEEVASGDGSAPHNPALGVRGELVEIDSPTMGRWEWEDVYPFDDTRCASGPACVGARLIDHDLGRPVCGGLDSDPDTGHDRSRWTTAFHDPAAPGRAWCEDCADEMDYLAPVLCTCGAASTYGRHLLGCPA